MIVILKTNKEDLYIAKVKKSWYLLMFLISISCHSVKKSFYNTQQKFTATELKEDFSILHKVLKANHPSLYWYSSKDSIDNFFLSTYASLKDSLTEQQFRKRVAWVINKIHCGHTVVRASKKYVKSAGTQKIILFPLLLKVWKDSAVVINNLFGDDSVFKRGTIITRINGVSVKEITDSICQLISSDGYSNIFQYQLISFNFPAFYKNAYGIDSNYIVQFADSAGKLNEKIVKNFQSKDGSSNNPQLLPGIFPGKPPRGLRLLGERNMEIDSSLNAAIISVNTFSKGKLLHFFRKSFKQIKRQNIKNVVLDLRLNTGGSVVASTRLSQYLINKPFRVSDTVAAYNRSFPYKKYIKPWLIYWLSMQISGKRMQDGRIHFRYFEKHYFEPKKKNHFNGNVYLLTGGYTFSAATLVASNLKGQQNVTIVGEETGGGAYGNSAMLLTTVVLPNTKLRVALPLFRMVLDVKRPKNGHGILPDIEVPPSLQSIKMGIDAKLEKVKQLIRQKSN